MTPDTGERGVKPRLLDLFCGAGGCTRGYQLAGFEVVGIDWIDQPRYVGEEFHRGDAIALGAELLAGGGFHAVHASPPCQAFSITANYPNTRDDHPDLVPATRELLAASGLPSVIENVPGAPIRPDLVLCGEMFGLRLHRHRWFETEGFFAMAPPHTRHLLRGARNNCHIEDGHARQVVGNFADLESAREAMGIPWMARGELAQAIPPAYTAFIGEYLLHAIDLDPAGEVA